MWNSSTGIGDMPDEIIHTVVNNLAPIVRKRGKKMFRRADRTEAMLDALEEGFAQRLTSLLMQHRGWRNRI